MRDKDRVPANLKRDACDPKRVELKHINPNQIPYGSQSTTYARR